MRNFIPFALLVTAFTGCRQYAFYQSPLHANTSSYKATPLKSDSMAAATYASVNFMVGGANHRWHDNTWSFTGSLHRSHNFGMFQAYYGANTTLGVYDVRPYITSNDTVNIPRTSSFRPFDEAAINSRSGNKFFGAWGLMGGINVVVPAGRKSEWRALGTELSWNQEFGRYLDYRKDLPAGAANIVSRKNNYFTISLFTEILGHLDNDNVLGYKIACITSPETLRGDDVTHRITPTYLSQTLHLRVRRATLYAQFNIGSYAANMQTGFSLRLGK
jgi:hypothetical protein